MPLTAKLAGLFLCAVIFLATPSTVSAEIDNQKLALGEIRLDQAIDHELDLAKQPESPKTPIAHKVTEGESLIVVAEKYKVDWQRIYDKNTSVKDPNIINPGDKLTIPEQDEKLDRRQVVVIEQKPVVAKQKVSSSKPAQNTKNYARGSSSGNTYSPGYCTYYAKQKRPDLPNSLGNASSWVSKARAQGLPTGSTPRVGAIGQSGNHVVYVEKINSNGTIVISEMNWTGLWNITTRTVSANSHQYIY